MTKKANNSTVEEVMKVDFDYNIGAMQAIITDVEIVL